MDCIIQVICAACRCSLNSKAWTGWSSPHATSTWVQNKSFVHKCSFHWYRQLNTAIFHSFTHPSCACPVSAHQKEPLRGFGIRFQKGNRDALGLLLHLSEQLLPDLCWNSCITHWHRGPWGFITIWGAFSWSYVGIVFSIPSVQPCKPINSSSAVTYDIFDMLTAVPYSQDLLPKSQSSRLWR